jgi:hypothetical protein
MDAVDMDHPFQYTIDERVALQMYQLQDHLKGTWLDARREATAQDPLYCYTVQGAHEGEYLSQ